MVYIKDCIFCKIVKGEIPSYMIWEDNKHLAFLDIFPSVDGMTVLIPKDHHSSYFAEVDNKVLYPLIDSAKEVALLLDSKLDGVLRTKLVFEGLDVEHLHVKLYPMYEGRPTPETAGGRASDEKLSKLAEQIRS